MATKARPYDYWVDGWPYSREWVKNPKMPRGRPYDGAIVNDEGELVIPHDAELTRRKGEKTI